MQSSVSNGRSYVNVTLYDNSTYATIDLSNVNNVSFSGNQLCFRFLSPSVVSRQIVVEYNWGKQPQRAQNTRESAFYVPNVNYGSIGNYQQRVLNALNYMIKLSKENGNSPW